MTPELNRTPLYEEHVNLKARIVEFGGWSMPVHYTSLLEEHMAVRNAVGIFDISHMGQFSVTGERASEWLDSMLTNNAAKLPVGQCQYSFLLNEKAGIIDDLIVYHQGPDNYLLVVNASRVEEDFSWMHDKEPADILFVNRSSDTAGIAIQGPNAPELFKRLFPSLGEYPKKNTVLEVGNAIVATTGYTGEEGFEVFCPAAEIVGFWRNALAMGADLGIKPCGLGARDTLRLEMCYPLNGSDLSRDRSPIEAGLGMFVDFTKPDFIGKSALLQQKQQGVECRLVALRVTTKSPPVRSHYPVYSGTELLGELTSGTFSPSLDTAIAMAYLPTKYSDPGTAVEIDVRSRRYSAVVERKPLYRKPGAASSAPAMA